jgi:hypothetical protein
MNAQHDIDRRLSAWLEDGPSRAPERSIEGVLAHARTHPRRRDPFAVLRKDPMNSNTFAASVRPLSLMAVLGLLLITAVAAASVGGWFNQQPSVVPPVVAPSPLASAAPSAAVFEVDLFESIGDDASITITDESHTVTSAQTGFPSDGGSVPDGEVDVRPLAGDPVTLELTWTGSPCDTTHSMTIEADGRTIVIERPACSGDAIPADHVLRLTFVEPVPAGEIDARVVTIGN